MPLEIFQFLVTVKQNQEHSIYRLIIAKFKFFVNTTHTCVESKKSSVVSHEFPYEITKYFVFTVYFGDSKDMTRIFFINSEPI